MATKRLRLLALLLLWQTACATPDAGDSIPVASPPDRIVLVVIDMLRRDHVGVYGASVATPNLDALGRRGQVVRNAVAAFGSTTMSMGSLFSGHTPSIETGRREATLQWDARNWCGLARLARVDDSPCVPLALETLAEGMQRAGYATLGVTSNLLLYEPAGFARGFELWEEAGANAEGIVIGTVNDARPTSGDYGGTLAGSVNLAVREVLKQRGADHFFLYVHYMDAHDFKEVGISYREGVERADAGVGDLLGLLAAEGLLEDSLVIVTSDHGERLGEEHPVPGGDQHFGNPSFESILRVPLIASQPIVPDPGRILRGQDLMRLMLGRVGEPRTASDELLPEESFYSEWEWQTYRRGQWKAAFRRSDGKALLFDLAADPGEVVDLATDHPERVEDFRERVSELTRSLSKPRQAVRDLSSEEREALRALGYLESVEAAEPAGGGRATGP